MDIWFAQNKAAYVAEELISLLHNITSEISANSQKTLTENEVRSLSNELFGVVNSKVADLKRDPKYRDPEFIDFFQLAIIALIDDTFLTMNWSGRNFWSSYLLETRFFSTRTSGDVFFENCQRIVRQNDLKSKELATIYYLCLAAGFRGKYLHVEYTEDINTIRTDLYNHATADVPNSKEFLELAVLPSGYFENTSKIRLTKKYSFFNRLLFFNFLVIIAFIITSYFIWFNNVNLIFRNL